MCIVYRSKPNEIEKLTVYYIVALKHWEKQQNTYNYEVPVEKLDLNRFSNERCGRSLLLLHLFHLVIPICFCHFLAENWIIYLKFYNIEMWIHLKYNREYKHLIENICVINNFNVYLITNIMQNRKLYGKIQQLDIS